MDIYASVLLLTRIISMIFSRMKSKGIKLKIWFREQKILECLSDSLTPPDGKKKEILESETTIIIQLNNYNSNLKYLKVGFDIFKSIFVIFWILGFLICCPYFHKKGFASRNQHDSRFGWLSVTTGYQNFGLGVVTVYHWLPKFWPQGCYRLPLVTISLVSVIDFENVETSGDWRVG